MSKGPVKDRIFLPHRQAVVLAVAATVAAVVVVVASPQGYGGQGVGGGGGDQGGVFPSATAQYTFKWDVDDAASGNFYGHMEEREGDSTRGRSVHLTKILIVKTKNQTIFRYF